MHFGVTFIYILLRPPSHSGEPGQRNEYIRISVPTDAVEVVGPHVLSEAQWNSARTENDPKARPASPDPKTNARCL